MAGGLGPPPRQPRVRQGEADGAGGTSTTGGAGRPAVASGDPRRIRDGPAPCGDPFTAARAGRLAGLQGRLPPGSVAFRGESRRRGGRRERIPVLRVPGPGPAALGPAAAGTAQTLLPGADQRDPLREHVRPCSSWAGTTASPSTGRFTASANSRSRSPDTGSPACTPGRRTIRGIGCSAGRAVRTRAPCPPAHRPPGTPRTGGSRPSRSAQNGRRSGNSSRTARAGPLAGQRDPRPLAGVSAATAIWLPAVDGWIPTR